MRFIDVFNGDADGICALHQLRLADPTQAALVTGVKRDIRLLDRVTAEAGDSITVLDISLDSNRTGLQQLLAAGAKVHWFDHHFAGDIPPDAGLYAMIDTAPDVCTSVLVDRHLRGRFRPWAVVAAFGDGLKAVGQRLAFEANLSGQDTEVLASLGNCLNYNAYGESVEDLWFAPADLYREIHAFVDPLAFVRESDIFRRLDEGYRQDMAAAQSLRPLRKTDSGAVYLMPAEPWARRAIGVFANQLAQAQPARAHALLSPNSGGGYTVSVRAPLARPSGADDLCRQFPGGGGRKAAAGINRLSADELDRFVEKFGHAFAI